MGREDIQKLLQARLASSLVARHDKQADQVPQVQIEELEKQDIVGDDIEDEFPEDIDDEFSKADGEVADSQDIFYVCKRTLELRFPKLKKSEDITKEDVTDLTSPAQLADEEIMVPVDMRGVNEEFEDVDQMIEKLGLKGTAEAFVKAHENFKANKDNEPEDERPAPMTAAKWRQILTSNMKVMMVTTLRMS